MKENLWLNLTDGTILCGRRYFDGLWSYLYIVIINNFIIFIIPITLPQSLSRLTLRVLFPLLLCKTATNQYCGF